MQHLRITTLASVLFVILPICFLSFGCGDDETGTGPDMLTLADFQGSWDAMQYTVASSDTPQISLDLIALGGSFTIDADDQGNFTGEAEIPEAVGGPVTLQYQGNFNLVTQDSMEVVFNPEIPPFLTSFVGAFELVADTMFISDNNTTFDFDQDGTEDPAIFEGTMVR